MRCIVAFSGCGGSSLGAVMAGHEVVLAIDNNRIALDSHKLNHPNSDHWCLDIRNVTYEMLKPYNADVFIGSPPCQSFTRASDYSIGKYNERKLDTDLVSKYLELAQNFKYWVMEEVPDAIPESGMFPLNSTQKILNACDFGVQQHRRRLFVANFQLPSSINGNSHIRTMDVVPTITATEYKGSKNDNRRGFTREHLQKHNKKPTIDDMKFYMGFPQDYKLVGNKAQQSIQIGNAVCPQVMAKVLEKFRPLVTISPITIVESI